MRDGPVTVGQGLAGLAAWMVVVVVGWVAATPFTTVAHGSCQRVGQAIVGPLQHLEHVDPKPGQYSEKDISPILLAQRAVSRSDEYKALFDGHFVDYRLQISGLVDNPVDLDLGAPAGVPARRHSPSTSASRAGPASPMGWSLDEPSSFGPATTEPNGSSSIPSAKEPTRAFTTTPRSAHGAGARRRSTTPAGHRDHDLSFGHSAPAARLGQPDRAAGSTNLGVDQGHRVRGPLPEITAGTGATTKTTILRLPAVHQRLAVAGSTG